MKKWQFAVIGLVVLILVGGGLWLWRGGGKVAATVNGVAIPETAVEKEIANYKQQQPSLFEGAAGKEQEKRLRASTLEVLINAELIRQEAKKRNVTVSEREVNERLAQVKKIFPDKKRYEQALKSRGWTEADLRVNVSDQAVAEKLVARVTGDIKISEADLKEFYEKNKAQMVEPERKRWRHILVKDKAMAETLLGQLEDGVDFAKLAGANSIDEGTKNNGGDLGLRQESDFSPEIAAGLKKVELNELSEIIKAADGYHIYQLTEVKAERTRPFEEVKSLIKQTVLGQRQRDKFTAWLTGLKKKAEINKL